MKLHVLIALACLLCLKASAEFCVTNLYVTSTTGSSICRGDYTACCSGSSGVLSVPLLGNNCSDNPPDRRAEVIITTVSCQTTDTIAGTVVVQCANGGMDPHSLIMPANTCYVIYYIVPQCNSNTCIVVPCLEQSACVCGSN